MNLTIGEKLSILRNRKNLSKVALSEITGIHKITLGKYEQNQMQPSIEALAKLVEALDASADYLLFDKEIPNIQDQELLALTEKADSLSDKDKERIKTLIKSYVEE